MTIVSTLVTIELMWCAISSQARIFRRFSPGEFYHGHLIKEVTGIAGRAGPLDSARKGLAFCLSLALNLGNQGFLPAYHINCPTKTYEGENADEGSNLVTHKCAHFGHRPSG